LPVFVISMGASAAALLSSASMICCLRHSVHLYLRLPCEQMPLPGHSLQKYAILPWEHMRLALHSAQFDLRLPWGQMPLPGHSRHMYARRLRLPWGQIWAGGRGGILPSLACPPSRQRRSGENRLQH
jgi:hypothetical protein